MKLFFSAIFFSLLATCCFGLIAAEHEKVLIDPAKERRNLLVGTWHGKQLDRSNGSKELIVSRKADATYHIRYRVIDNSGEEVYRIEFGSWGISDSIYFTTIDGWFKKDGSILTADPEEPFIYNAYRIEKLNASEFIYRSYSKGDTYILKKVDDDYNFW